MTGDVRSFGGSEDAHAWVNYIARTTGISAEFRVIVADVDNAVAYMEGGVRVVAFSPQFMTRVERGDSWNPLGILAHEIGHHANSHFVRTRDWATRRRHELEADRFAGYALARMGADEEAIVAYGNIFSVAGAGVHPPRAERFASAMAGWRDGASGSRIDPSERPPHGYAPSRVNVPSPPVGRHRPDPTVSSRQALQEMQATASQMERDGYRPESSPLHVRFSNGQHVFMVDVRAGECFSGFIFLESPTQVQLHLFDSSGQAVENAEGWQNGNVGFCARQTDRYILRVRGEGGFYYLPLRR